MDDISRALKKAIPTQYKTLPVELAINHLIAEVKAAVKEVGPSDIQHTAKAAPAQPVVKSSDAPLSKPRHKQPEKGIQPKSQSSMRASDLRAKSAMRRPVSPPPSLKRSDYSDVVKPASTSMSSSPVPIFSPLHGYLRQGSRRDLGHAARKVFGVPELLQMILLHLDWEVLLKIQQVSQGFKTVIDNSISIQRRMSLAPSVYFQNPFENCTYLPGFSHGIMPENDDQSIDSPQSEATALRVVVSKTQDIAVKIGSRCRQLLVVQPPLYEMTIHAYCCGRTTASYNGLFLLWTDSQGVVSNPSGITIGDIFDAYEEAKASHRFCPMAPVSSHKPDGTVQPLFAFQGVLRLRNDDPMVQRALDQSLRPSEEGKGMKKAALAIAKTKHLEHYVAAKKSAHANGLPIPTPAEFEAANPIAVDD